MVKRTGGFTVFPLDMADSLDGLGLQPLDRDTLAPSNAALVRRTVEVCEKYERPVATYMQARETLGLRPFAC